MTVLTAQDYASEEEIRAFNRAQPFRVERLRRIPGAPVEAVYRLFRGVGHIRRTRPDLLVATGERAVQVAGILAPLHRIPWIAVGHGGEFGTPSRFAHAVVRRMYSRATAVVCVSEFTRRFMEEREIRPRRVFVVPNGADDRRFRLVDRREIDAVIQRLGLPAPSQFILTVGNVCDRKGQEIVIRALPEVLKRVPEAHYLVVGLPTIAKRLGGIARELGVERHVHFLGRLDPDSVRALMNLADVFAMTSRRTLDGDFEGFGIAVVESALCGTPAVVTAGSGLSEAIEDGRTGIAVPEGDVGRVAAAVERLLSDEALRRRMGEDARCRALSEQTWTRRAGEFEEILRGLVGGDSGESRPGERTGAASG